MNTHAVYELDLDEKALRPEERLVEPEEPLHWWAAAESDKLGRTDRASHNKVT